MGALSITDFGGMLPQRERTLLPPNLATDALNLWPYSGTLRGVTLPKFVHSCASSSIKKVYRITNDITTNDMSGSTWLEFTDPDTDVCRNPVLADSFERYYWASKTQGAPKMNTKARITGGQAAYDVGVPVPDKALLIQSPNGELVDGATVLLPGQTNQHLSSSYTQTSPTTEGDPFSETATYLSSQLSAPLLQTRSYLYTYVTQYGEEGPPSPPTTADGGVGGTWNVFFDGTGSFAAALARGCDKIRLYRTVTSALGVASFIKLADITMPGSPSGLTYVDTKSDADIASNPILPSTDWAGPPNLEGMVTLANGILAGWKGSDVYFSEPYHPHAWPAAYSITVEHPIVGIGVYAQSLVLCTVGNPVIISGVRPATMSTSKVPMNLPCLSRGSILSSASGVTYATNDGLVQITQSGVNVLTQGMVSREQWVKQYNPRKLRGGKCNATSYMGWVCDGTSTAGLTVDVVEQKVGLSRLAKATPVDSITSDVWTGETLITSGGNVFLWDPQDSSARLPYRWCSKQFQYQKPNNFSCGKVYCKPVEAETLSTSVGNWGSPPSELTLPGGADILFRLYADDRLVLERPVTHSQLFRFPSGFYADYWRLEVVSRTEIMAIHFASSAKELISV